MLIGFDGFLLLDPDARKQAIFNSEKVARKIFEEDRNLYEAFLEAAIGNKAKLTQWWLQSPDKATLFGQMVLSIKSSNALEDYVGSIFMAGYESSK